MTPPPRYLIIPAAGRGTRMQGVRPGLPKELLPVAGRPAIQAAIEEGRAAGIDRVTIILGKNKEQIRHYIEEPTSGGIFSAPAVEQMEQMSRECSISFVYQSRPRGEADAISCARQLAGDAVLAIIYPDNIVSPPGALRDLIEAHLERARDVAALMPVTEADAPGLSNSGRVDIDPVGRSSLDLFRIVKIHAKGRGHFVPRWPRELRSCGISVFGPHLFEYIERARGRGGGSEELTDGLVRRLMLRERELLGLCLTQRVFDIGNPVGYERCRRALDTSDASGDRLG